MELEASAPGGSAANGPGSLNLAAITAVFTIELVAQMLGVDADYISQIAMTDMDPGHGHLSIYGSNDCIITGFTRDGIDHLEELIEDRKTWTD